MDNVVPEGAAGDYVNAFEKLRDPSHNRCLSMREWRDGFLAAGLEVQCEEILRKQIPFEFWAARHDPTMQRYLRAMLTETAELAATFLEPQAGEEGTIFHLTEGIFVGRKP